MSRRLKVIGTPSGAGAFGVGQEQGHAAMRAGGSSSSSVGRASRWIVEIDAINDPARVPT